MCLGLPGCKLPDPALHIINVYRNKFNKYGIIREFRLGLTISFLDVVAFQFIINYNNDTKTHYMQQSMLRH